MMKNRLYDSLIFVCIFLISASIPFAYFIDNETLVYWLQIGLKIAFLVFAYFFLKKSGLTKPRFSKPKTEWLFYIPFLLACCSNFFIIFFDSSAIKNEPNMSSIFLGLLFAALTAVCEELTFRVVLMGEIRNHQSEFKSMLIASAIFGGIHLFNASSFADIGVCAVQAVYTFGIGMILSLLYFSSKNYIIPVFFHLFFNFFNDTLFANFFSVEYNFIFFLVNGLIAVLLIGYWALIYFKRLKQID